MGYLLFKLTKSCQVVHRNALIIPQPDPSTTSSGVRSPSSHNGHKSNSTTMPGADHLIQGLSGDPLVDLYNRILLFIRRDCGTILDICERKLASNLNWASESAIIDPLCTYNILVNVIWDEVTKRLDSELGHMIFAAGRPDTFHSVCLLIGRSDSLP